MERQQLDEALQILKLSKADVDQLNELANQDVVHAEKTLYLLSEVIIEKSYINLKDLQVSPKTGDVVWKDFSDLRDMLRDHPLAPQLLHQIVQDSERIKKLIEGYSELSSIVLAYRAITHEWMVSIGDVQAHEQNFRTDEFVSESFDTTVDSLRHFVNAYDLFKQRKRVADNAKKEISTRVSSRVRIVDSTDEEEESPKGQDSFAPEKVIEDATASAMTDADLDSASKDIDSILGPEAKK